MNNNPFSERCVLLPLRPRWWDQMLDYRKGLEIRKTAPSSCTWPIRVIVYLPAPRKEIVGEFISEGYIKTNIFRFLTTASCLTMEELKEYANGDPLCAWLVNSPVKYKTPHKLEEVGIKRAPQSWCYCEAPTSWMRG